MPRVAILQSNYIPWKGYFDIIHDVDIFVFYDEVQYTRRDWRNRNQIKTPQGVQWLSVPTNGTQEMRICDVEICDDNWGRKHWETLRHAYGKAPHFRDYADFFEEVYLRRTWRKLSELNQTLLKEISTRFLGIQTRFVSDQDLHAEGTKQERLLSILKHLGADAYLSGPAARSYITPAAFAEVGIELTYKNYAGYPEYPQLYPPFRHDVTILDMLFHLGKATPDTIWGWREGAKTNA